MIASPFVRTLRVCVPLAVAGLLALAGTSYGAANPPCDPDHGACAFSFGDTYEIDRSFEIVGCWAQLGDTATIVGTGEIRGGGTFSNDPTNSFFHYRYALTEAARITFADGTYAVDDFTTHFTYNSGQHPRVLTRTEPLQERATIYSADGRPTGQVVMVHAVQHFTWIDVVDADGNTNGEPDDGDQFLANVDQFRITCR